MRRTKLDKRFFDSSRGQIVLLLRESARTVNELAERTNLTDNAVRAHLIALERDGLVQQTGLVKGFRKPHYTYGLTEDARHLFPTAYDALLSRLITVLKRRFSRKTTLIETLREVGHELAGNVATSSASLDERLEQTLSVLASVGGSARVTREEGRVRIESDSCPFADVVSDHPEVCKVTETIVADILCTDVVENCDRENIPKCRFQVLKPTT